MNKAVTVSSRLYVVDEMADHVSNRFVPVPHRLFCFFAYCIRRRIDLQRPVSVTNETPHGGGLDSFPIIGVCKSMLLS